MHKGHWVIPRAADVLAALRVEDEAVREAGYYLPEVQPSYPYAHISYSAPLHASSGDDVEAGKYGAP